ncbi:flagellar protein export ATPase FliI [Jeotgalibacillus proteolyticus]|uniref:Flagellar protein export ATPase FliI n=1 Tax=Jeotgalibacillus proteolyticus TaxID=2082395 RepID=A0A2S5GGA5_9BACL|nr:flagellar protein export ATPase FliI [Jeotgalibacillus proteolyticus]PPA72057.1 flagellar protein export ATPase FliI [Jeotgalibacillus proteolyticus]
MKAADLLPYVEKVATMRHYGKVKQVIGLMIESQGPKSSIGELCYIHVHSSFKKKSMVIKAEVVGFKEEIVVLMPYTHIQDISPGSIVEATGGPLEIKVGESLIGQVVDPLGIPIDETPLPDGMETVITEQEPPNPLTRPPIHEVMEVGVRSIDAMLAVGKGQRIGIFAGSGVGKSTLLGMVARNTEADLNVIALVGERGREVREFIERDLGPEGVKRSIIVAATSDQPALMRIKGAYTATAIAEYFRDKGLNVMLMMDSVTRVAMAQREIGLAIGEPPATKGYTPSVFGILPKLLERTGTNQFGSITAFYTVLVDGDDMNEPIADTVRGILDGHIVLDRTIANRGQYPAINVLKSVSRLMNHLAEPKHLKAAEKVRQLLSTHSESEDLINIGAYKKGSSQEIDDSINAAPHMKRFFKQAFDEKIEFSTSVHQLIDLADKGEW